MRRPGDMKTAPGPMARGLCASRVSGLEVHASAAVAWPPPAPRLLLSGMSVTSVSVVRTIAAMEAAFWSAERVTLAASTMPS